MAYFGDALAHSALLGVALGALLGTDFRIGILGTSLAFALLLFALQRQGRLATDTLLGILSHAALSLGLVALAFIAWLRIDLMAYLFGDVLSVTWVDVAWIWGGGVVLLAILVSIWDRLLAATVQEELARAEGVPVAAVRFVFMLLIALVVAVA